jgi:hypothetical protein
MYKLDPDSEVSKSLQRLVYDISTKRNENSVQDNDLEQKKIVKHEGEMKVMESNIA